MDRAIKLFSLILACLASNSVLAENNEDLAKQLTNPVADLISVPFQYNYNTHININNTGHQSYINIQPVIPFSLTSQWNLISRTILPVINQENLLPTSGSQTGLGDIVQSFFLSPSNEKLIWGVGPAIQIPTATHDLLGTGKWSIGPTAVILKMTGPWTIGMLANQLWSVAGERDRPAYSQAFIQPFIAYTTKSAWTYSLNSESAYDWKGNKLSIPINAVITKVTSLNNMPISLSAGIRYWATTPDTGPKDFGARFVITFLFPKT